MKSLKYILLALFVGLTPHVFAQVNLDDLAQAVAESPDNAAALVEEAVAANPDQVNQIVTRLIAEFPELAEEIIFGAIAGLPSRSPDDIAALVQHAVRQAPGLAPELVLGARRATTNIPGMSERITVTVRDALRTIGSPIGQTSGSSAPDVQFNDTLRISPANN